MNGHVQNVDTRMILQKIMFYSCAAKELYFHFKKEWHSVAEFASENLTELVSEGGKVFSRPFEK